MGHFKPDFAPYYLTNCNYICHIAAFPAKLFWQVGGLRPEFDGSQDHDLFFRLTEKTKRSATSPRCSITGGCTRAAPSGGVGAKPYVAEAAKRAIDEHLARKKVKGRAVDGRFPSIYKVEYDLRVKPLVSILIPNKDHVEDLSRCLESLYGKTTWPKFEVVVIENNSQDEATFRYYEEQQGRA